MATIPTLQIPQMGAVSGGADFAPLAQLGNIYQKAQQDAANKAAFATFQQTGDPRALIGSGDMNLAQLGISAQNHMDALKQQAIENTFRQNQDRRAGAAERRAAAEDENTPYQYKTNPDGTVTDVYEEARARAKAGEGPLGKAREREKLLLERGIDPKSPEGQAYILGGDWTGSSAGGASLNPVYGTVNGQPAMVQTTKTGRAIQTQLPEGFQIAKDPIRVDAGTHINLVDPQTRQVIGTLPKNVAEVERQKVVGEEQAKAQVALPQVESTSKQILKTIADVKDHPGKKWSLGAYSKLPTVPGTEQANFRVALGQLQGQTFLQAYQTLRGGGAITDIEGAKGTAALNAMNTAQTEEAFNKAADDFAAVVKGGVERAKAKASAPAGGVGPAAQPTSAQDALKSKYGLD